MSDYNYDEQKKVTDPLTDLLDKSRKGPDPDEKKLEPDAEITGDVKTVEDVVKELEKHRSSRRIDHVRGAVMMEHLEATIRSVIEKHLRGGYIVVDGSAGDEHYAVYAP